MPGRRLGVVLDVADDAVGHEAIEARRRRRGREARVREGEAVLLGRQVELAAQLLVTQQRALEATERAVQRLRCRRRSRRTAAS